MDNKRVELYKAVKYEVVNFVSDHGCTVAQMWAIVTGKDPKHQTSAEWWKKTCLEDYRTQAKF